ncbi:hypothetical protein LM602_03815 [Candidatus Acetothermia bacterium]|nr:hypothetical protein [Candidatus Acetothermia bacterium]MCI2431668.1 hypothetical protein [Candidatus Acetothermia bacterium]MCI2436384.1 hypothetical protein [Candidatus Acetothermia bacterium]
MGRLWGVRAKMSVRWASLILLVSLFGGWQLLTGLSQASGPSLPELHPISLVLTPPSPVEKGLSVMARAKIVNSGASPATRFTVEFFYRLKSDLARPWLPFPEGKGVITLAQGLRPQDQAVTVEGILETLRTEIAPGSYEIRVLVDSGNQIPEQDETNNELIVGLQIRPSRLGRPDLQPTALIFTPASPIALNELRRREIAVSATVRNSGTADAGATKVQYLFCKLPNPRSACRSDQLSEFARVDLTELKVGQEQTIQAVLKAADLTPGAYFVQVRVDPPSSEQPNGAIEEQDESNNTLATLLTIKGPELYAESILLTPALVRSSDDVTAEAKIANAGEAPATDVVVAFLLNGRLLASTVIKELPAGRSEAPARQSAQAVLKTGALALRPGVYELRVVVDPEDQIIELDESNNTLITALTIQPALPKLPELTPKSLRLTPPSPIEQGVGTVTAEILNNGSELAENFEVEFSVRELGRLRWNSLVCTVNCSKNKLNPNGELVSQAQLPPLIPGSYEIRVVVDPQNTVEELDETNNEMAVAFRIITPRKPDLAIIRLAFDPAALSVQPGQAVRMIVGIENIGDAPAAAFSAQCAQRRVEELNPNIFQRFDVPPLAPGERVTRECRLETSSLRPGFYELSVLLDPEGKIDEQNKANNSATSGAGVPGEPGQVGQALLILGPDLLPDRATLEARRPKTTSPLPPSPPPVRITQGEALETRVTVRNRGALAAGGFDVAFCLRALATQPSCAEAGTRSRATGLGLQDEFPARTTLITEGLAPGLYEIGVLVDPAEDGRPFGRVEEINERNNIIGGLGNLAGLFVEILGKPDLRFRRPLVLDPPGPIPTGVSTVRVFADIENAGAGPTTRAFTIEFAFRRVDDPNQPDPPFTVFGTASTSDLEVGPEKSKQVKADLDLTNLGPGVYEIRVLLDRDDLIPETDKTNNRETTRIFVGRAGGPADLAALSLTPNPASVVRGQPIRLSAVVANLGTVAVGPFRVTLAHRSLWGGGPEMIFSNQLLPGLAAGARLTLTAELNTGGLAPGLYEIILTVDPDNRIPETNEENNRIVITVNIN